MEQKTETTKQRIVSLIYEQASQALSERATANTDYERASIDGERSGLRQLLKTIEREIED